VDTTGLRAAYQSFLAVARSEGFGPPPPPEWTAAQLLAHIIAGDTAITAVALAVAEQLTDAEADISIPTLIISNDQVVLDSSLPLRSLIDGLGHVHLPRHAEQLAA
jgi:hypothetical protein